MCVECWIGGVSPVGVVDCPGATVVVGSAGTVQVVVFSRTVATRVSSLVAVEVETFSEAYSASMPLDPSLAS